MHQGEMLGAVFAGSCSKREVKFKALWCRDSLVQIAVSQGLCWAPWFHLDFTCSMRSSHDNHCDRWAVPCLLSSAAVTSLTASSILEKNSSKLSPGRPLLRVHKSTIMPGSPWRATWMRWFMRGFDRAKESWEIS